MAAAGVAVVGGPESGRQTFDGGSISSTVSIPNVLDRSWDSFHITSFAMMAWPWGVG